jgi:uncharacterized lipoprotein YmbA
MIDAASLARLAATALGCLVLAPACLGRTQVRYYTLAGTPPTEPAPADLRYTVHIAPAVVPEALDRPELVLRVSATEVAIDDNHRWVESLPTGIARAVADRLSRDLAGARVSASQPLPAQPSDVEVRLEVRSLEVGLTAGAVIDVAWTARWAGNGATRTGRSIGRAPPGPGGGHDAAVAACSAALDIVGNDIARAMRLEHLSRR